MRREKKGISGPAAAKKGLVVAAMRAAELASVVAFCRRVVAFCRRVVVFCRRVVAFRRRVVAFRRRVFVFSEGIAAFRRRLGRAIVFRECIAFRRRVAVFRVVALGVCIVACSGNGRRETAQLIEAIDRYRQAAPADRQARERGVGAVPCSAAAVCETKRLCLEAIAPTTRALDLKDEVMRRLGDIERQRLDPAAPEAAALPQKLDEASTLLEVGRTKMTACERGLADLRVKFGP